MPTYDRFETISRFSSNTSIPSRRTCYETSFFFLFVYKMKPVSSKYIVLSQYSGMADVVESFSSSLSIFVVPLCVLKTFEKPSSRLLLLPNTGAWPILCLSYRHS